MGRHGRKLLVVAALLVPALLGAAFVWQGRPARAEALSLPGPGAAYHYQHAQFHHWHDVLLQK